MNNRETGTGKETLAAEYKAACADLLAMHETLKTVRADIGELAKAEGYTPPVFAPVFTAGLDSSRLVVSKPDYKRLPAICYILCGKIKPGGSPIRDDLQGGGGPSHPVDMIGRD